MRPNATSSAPACLIPVTRSTRRSSAACSALALSRKISATRPQRSARVSFRARISLCQALAP